MTKDTVSMTKDTIRRDDLHIGPGNSASLYEHLTEVHGTLYIHDRGQLPNLTKVTGALIIHDSPFELPVLESVGGRVGLYTHAALPALRTVGDRFYASSMGADLPVLESIGGRVSQTRGFNAPKLRSVAGHALPDAELIAARVENVARAALATEDALYMNDWHRCDTAHCIAGWGIHQAGIEGYDLEEETDPETAGLILLGVEAAGKFFTDNDEAKAWLQSKLVQADA